MAVKRNDVDLLTGGVTTGEEGRSSWVQNMWKPAGVESWSVRPGFGQRAQFDAGLSANLGEALTGEASEPGFYTHLGSHLFETQFGHQQILSVFRGTAFSEHRKWAPRLCYFAQIYDLNTNASWSEPLYKHTCQMEEVSSPLQTYAPSQAELHAGTLPFFSAHQETNSERDFSAFYKPQSEAVYFATIFDSNKNSSVFFGNQHTGLWAYYPTDLRTQDWHQYHRSYLQTYFSRSQHSGAAEASIIKPVVPADGPFSEGYTYRSSADFPTARAATTFQGRLVLADENSIFFSDMGYPGSFIGRNVQEIPVQSPITAMINVNDNLMIFTDHETWFYAPKVGALQSGGRLIQINNEIGCLSSNSVISTGEEAFWVDKNGIYATQNGTSVKEISSEIQGFFRDSVTSPLTQYFQQTGGTDLSNEQPRTTLSFDKNDLVSIAYHEKTKALILACPSLNMLWCRTDGWSSWPLESAANGTAASAAVVKATQNITNPWVMASKDGIFVLGGPEVTDVTDTLVYGVTGIAAGLNTRLASHYLLELGRGGALDRSVEAEEDTRKLPGQYDPCPLYFPASFIDTPGAGLVRIYITPALGVSLGYSIGDSVAIKLDAPNNSYDGSFIITSTGTDGTGDYLQYVSAVLPAGLTVVTGFFQINSIANTSVTFSTSNNCMIVRPPEKVFGEYDLLGNQAYLVTFEWNPPTLIDQPDTVEMVLGYDRTKWVPIFSGASNVEVIVPSERLANSAGFSIINFNSGGAPVTTGDELHITYQDAPLYPTLKLITGVFNPFVSFKMYCLAETTDDAISGYGFNLKGFGITSAKDSISVPTYEYGGRLLVWNPYIVKRHQANDVAQAVDWAYKSNQVGLKAGGQFKARGLYSSIVTHGQPTTPEIAPEFTYGLYNTILSSTWKDWSSQVIDYDGDITMIANHETVRTRVRNTATSLIKREFASVRFGDEAQISNYVSGAATIVTSAATTGLLLGDIVVIKDSPVVQLNGMHTVTLVAGNDITISLDTTALPGGVTTGSIELHNAYVIDDEELDTVSTSDSVRGESVSYMVFGFMRDIAMKLTLQQLKAVIFPVAGRRRRGR